MEIYLLLVALVIVLIFLVTRYKRKADIFKGERDEIDSKKRSQSTLYGKISEQFAPFMDKYPYDFQKFRFIGTPIDGIQFEDDKIVFVEIKSATSDSTQRQRKIRKLVQSGTVEWYEFDIRERNQ